MHSKNKFAKPKLASALNKLSALRKLTTIKETEKETVQDHEAGGAQNCNSPVILEECTSESSLVTSVFSDTYSEQTMDFSNIYP